LTVNAPYPIAAKPASTTNQSDGLILCLSWNFDEISLGDRWRGRGRAHGARVRFNQPPLEFGAETGKGGQQNQQKLAPRRIPRKGHGAKDPC
jgi:hypothetical protein